MIRLVLGSNSASLMSGRLPYSFSPKSPCMILAETSGNRLTRQKFENVFALAQNHAR
jgi:hypothetical protein